MGKNFLRNRFDASKTSLLLREAFAYGIRLSTLSACLILRSRSTTGQLNKKNEKNLRDRLVSRLSFAQFSSLNLWRELEVSLEVMIALSGEFKLDSKINVVSAQVEVADPREGSSTPGAKLQLSSKETRNAPELLGRD